MKMNPHISPIDAPSLVFFALAGTYSLNQKNSYGFGREADHRGVLGAYRPLNQKNSYGFGRERPLTRKIQRDLHITW